MEKERVVFADWLRALSCFLVMLVHASENFYGAETGLGLASNMSYLANEVNRFWVAFYDGGVARACVPLFMMMSAFLLVPMKPGVTMVQFYRRRFLRILPPFVCFLVLYSVLPLAWGGMTWEQSVADLKGIIWNFPSLAGHLWFIYPLISIYLIIPIVSPWLEKASAKDERMFLYFFILSTFIPAIHKFVTPELWGECFWNGFNALWYCSGYLGYLVLAHYIRFHIDWSPKKRLAVGAASFIVGAVVSCWGFWWKGVPGQGIETPILEWAWEFCTPNVLLQTFGIFLMFTAIKAPKCPRIVTGLSKLSFGMYLMHMFFLTPYASLVIGSSVADPRVPVYMAIPVIAILTYVTTAAVTKLISLIPGSKWVVGI